MTQVAAGILLRNGRVLLGLRAPGGNCGGLWEFPGGKLEPGETPEQCLVRECIEEVGLLVEPVKLISRVVYPFPDQPIELFFYQVRAGEGEPSPFVHQKLCWAPVEELDRYAFSPANREALANIKRLHQNEL